MPSNEDAITIKAHIDGVDAVAQEIETKWGVERLPLLVEADLRARFMRQAEKWSEALQEAFQSKMLTVDQLDRVRSSSAAMERAWKALDDAATKAGKKPIEAQQWECVLADGTLAVIVRTNAEAGHVIREGRCLNVWTLEEVARAIDHMPEAVRAAKETFPGAKVTGLRERRGGVKLDDPLPF